ncbi:MAG: BolA/IbaG family iron-sulfur metabolism protein, partial [Proteobacteria bacterium]|nr:BolA/IbaG family iron-sulfur metabolism protein [Pseudomonadota bacterium]
MRIQQSIRTKLEQAYAPLRLEIEDQSARHAGHAGAHPEGESHF